MSEPKLLILSGVHGDEREVISCVKKYLTSHKQLQYMYIPEVSPSAVSKKTRLNAYGKDVNREFFDPPQDPEAKALMEKVSSRHFDLALDFHEDPDLEKEFYMYDSGRLPDKELALFRKKIQATGAVLLTGIDDPLDAHLGFHITEGYISTAQETLPQNAGFSATWLLTHNIVDRSFVIEIPGKASAELKQKLVDAIFDTIRLFGT